MEKPGWFCSTPAWREDQNYICESTRPSLFIDWKFSVSEIYKLRRIILNDRLNLIEKRKYFVYQTYIIQIKNFPVRVCVDQWTHKMGATGKRNYFTSILEVSNIIKKKTKKDVEPLLVNQAWLKRLLISHESRASGHQNGPTELHLFFLQ